MAPTIQPLPPAGKPDTPDPREPALAPLIPAALEDGLDTIRPAAVEAAAPVDTRQPPAIKEAAQGVTQPAQPQIRPASPATDFDAAVSGTAGVDQAPTIEIHIGRVELRQAAPVTQQTPPVRSRFEPPLSLNAYLERRNGGGE